jgi:hypothetical protein
VRVVGEQVAVQHRLHERAQREPVGRADEMDRRAHEGDPHRPPLGEQGRDILGPALGESGPQPHIPGVRSLRLQADEVLDGLQRGEVGAAQEQLPVEGGAVEGAAGQRQHAGTPEGSDQG